MASREQLLKLLSIPRSDAGNSESFALLHGGRFRYDHSRGKWHVFNGRYWAADENGEAQRAALHTARQRFLCATLIPDRDLQRDIADWALRSESTYALRAMLTSAQSIEQLATVAADYDRDPFLFTVGNGTLDLRTGELRDFRREDLITRASEVIYAPDAECPRWDKFLDDIFMGDKSLSSFVQRAVGYSLTGDTREQCLFPTFGPGNNGKSTFLETTLKLVGSHGTITPFSTFLVRQNPGSPRNDLASLHGARLVKAAESQRQAILDEAVIKEITGQDSIAVRFLFKEQFTYFPTYKIWLTTNHRPTISGTDDAIWRRIRLIPFNRQFTGKDRDPRLREKLEMELSGILAWAVRGCLEWQRVGLGNAPQVEAATLNYRRESDHFGRFLTDCCTDRTRDQASGQEVFDAYVKWCAEHGERPESNNVFAQALADRGMKKKRTKKGVVYTGIGLRPTAKRAKVDKS
jgi:putative DNA primase/helicase